MTDHVANCPISRPKRVPGVTPDRDLNGIMWSNKHGLIFYPETTFDPIQTPAVDPAPPKVK